MRQSKTNCANPKGEDLSGSKSVPDLQPLDSPATLTLENLGFSTASKRDLSVLALQLSRTPRGVLAIGARCICGNPAVVVTAPRLENKTPFPTLFYLTLPALTRGLSKLEAEKKMVYYNHLLETDKKVKQHYAQAHRTYITLRDQVAKRYGIQEVPEISNVSAGGMPNRVKCLHALAGYSLACGSGVNPIGDLALAELTDLGLWDPKLCYCTEDIPA